MPSECQKGKAAGKHGDKTGQDGTAAGQGKENGKPEAAHVYTAEENALYKQDMQNAVKYSELKQQAAKARRERGRLSKKELAAEISVSERTVNRWMDDKTVPFIKGKRSVRFDLPAVLKALQKKAEEDEESGGGEKK